MTTLREAATQALEALTAHADLHSTMYLKMDAIAALRAALAEPVESPCATRGCMPSRCPNCASLEAQNTELDRKLAEMERKLLELQAAVLQSQGIRSGDA